MYSRGSVTEPQSPIRRVAAIATSDVADQFDVNNFPRKLLCTAAGNIKVDFLDGGQATFAVTAGQLVEVAIKRLYTTGTTATVLAAH